MATREDVLIRFGGDARGVTGTLNTIRSGVKSLSSYVGSIAAGFGIAAVFNKTITATREQNQALAQLDATIKSTGGIAGLTREELTGLAAEMQRLTNYGDEAVISMESILGTFTQIKDKAIFRDATVAILDLSTKLGQDLKSSAVQVGKALNDPIAGITALKRVGVSFTDTQQKIIKNLVETNRLAEAQKLIIAELNTEFGGSAKAAADPMIQLANAFGDLFESSSDANDEIKQLTATLQDPAVVAGMQSITVAVFTATGALAELAAGTAWSAKAFGEWVAQMQGFIAAEDLPDKIYEVRQEVAKLTTLVNAKETSRFGKWWYGDALEKALKVMNTLIDRQKALASPTTGGTSTKRGTTATPAASTTVTGVDASKSFKDYTTSLVQSRQDAATKTKSITSQQYTYELEILNQYNAEVLATRKGQTEAAQAAQTAQEAAFKKLADISKNSQSLQYYQDLVGQEEKPIEIKTKIVVDKTEIDGIPSYFEQMAPKVKVYPEIQWGATVPGATPTTTLPEGQGITREVDQTGANP